MEFLGKYRGAALLKDIKYLDVSDEQTPAKKVRSEGIHPELDNLKVEFSAFGDSWKEAENNIAKQIDKYLDEHDLDEFDFDKLDLKKP